MRRARRIHGTVVRGVDVGPETGCSHYDGYRDVVAFKFACCERHYPCFRCHEAVSNHDAVPWPYERFDEPSVLCGVCGVELTAPGYLESDHACPECDTAFNPGCANHHDRYFATSSASIDGPRSDGTNPGGGGGP